VIAVGCIEAQAKTDDEMKVIRISSLSIYLIQSLVIVVMAFWLVSVSGHAASVWRVDGGEATVFLAGSIHFLRSGDKVPAVYEKVYSQSDTIALEVEPHRLKESGATGLYIKEGRCGAGKQISDYLNTEVQELLERRLQQMPQHAAAIHYMRPWMASMFLTIWELQRLGAEPELGVDHAYYRQAIRDGKTTTSLEIPRAHVMFLASLSHQEENVFLKQTLLTLDDTEMMFDELVAAWQQGEESVLAEWFHDIQMQESGIIEKLLLQRNRNWINRLEEYLQGEQTVMVIAGVAHMVGPGSVIDLLKKRGYTIRKLN